MNDTYTRKQAMERLGIKSKNAFNQLVKKYPEAFINVNQGRYPLYERATLDRFARLREAAHQFKRSFEERL